MAFLTGRPAPRPAKPSPGADARDGGVATPTQDPRGLPERSPELTVEACTQALNQALRVLAGHAGAGAEAEAVPGQWVPVPVRRLRHREQTEPGLRSSPHATATEEPARLGVCWISREMAPGEFPHARAACRLWDVISTVCFVHESSEEQKDLDKRAPRSTPRCAPGRESPACTCMSP